MSNNNLFTVTFWGVRGSIPVPGATTLKYGGNTSCVEVRCGDRTLVLDAGTGIAPLGAKLGSAEVDILLSHTHLDHIQGFPFFRPIYNPTSTVRVWAGHLKPAYTVEAVIGHVMQPPIFPLTISDLRATLEFIDFTAGEPLSSPCFTAHGMTIRTLPLNHPDGATAYRIEYQGHSVCYVTDVEHAPGKVDEALVNFIKDTDLFIYDCTFNDKEFERYWGWGHSTWQEAIRIANVAHCKTAVIFHHHPEATDEALDHLAHELKETSVNAVVAYEGLMMSLS